MSDCGADGMLCNDRCTSITSYSQCGACDSACGAGQACLDGSCTDTCPVGTRMVDGACVAYSADSNNCGGPGIVCAAGSTCLNSSCVSFTGNGLVQNCLGRPVNLSTTLTNCGTCGNSCAAGQICTQGTCVGTNLNNGVACGPDQSLCQGGCVNLRSEFYNCGTCGASCSLGQTCYHGQCQDLPTLVTTLGGSATNCGTYEADTSSDPNNCGACRKACPLGQTCSGGTCTTSCPSGETLFANSCYSPTSSPLYCGTNHQMCAVDQACSSGSCVACTSATGHALCNGVCVNTTNDSVNCGGCAPPSPANPARLAPAASVSSRVALSFGRALPAGPKARALSTGERSCRAPLSYSCPPLPFSRCSRRPWLFVRFAPFDELEKVEATACTRPYKGRPGIPPEKGCTRCPTRNPGPKAPGAAR